MPARVAWVTGATGGVGQALCHHLADLGHRVLALGRDERRLAQLAADAESAGRVLSTAQCEVTDEDSVTRICREFGAPEILVNNAGVSTAAPVHRTTRDDWEHHMTVNATSAFLVTRGVLPAMRERGWGRVVSVASTAGRVGTPYTAAYSASKHAMLGLMRVVASEVAGSEVTSNAVCPTFVRTPMTERSVLRIADRTGRSTADAQDALTRASPLGRLLEPEEVAAAVAYLVSEKAGCVNGQSLVLDGGGVQA